MKLESNKIKELCDKSGRSLSEVLRSAGVSRTAYYSLSRKDLILPKSVRALAEELGVNVSDLIFDESREIERVRLKQDLLNLILKTNPRIDRNNAWHTLLSLDRTPLERLNQSLSRGRK